MFSRLCGGCLLCRSCTYKSPYCFVHTCTTTYLVRETLTIYNSQLRDFDALKSCSQCKLVYIYV